jgi:type IV secretory pathway TrbD component
MPTDDDVPPMTRVHRSLFRPFLLFGCEPGPLVATGAVIFSFIVILHTWLTFAAGIVLAVVAIPALRAAARNDPYFSRVWVRALRKYPQREYYAHPDIAAATRKVDE